TSAGAWLRIQQIRVISTSPWLHDTPSAGVTVPDRYLNSRIAEFGSLNEPQPLQVFENSAISPGPVADLRYLMPTKPEPAKNGGPKMSGEKVQPAARSKLAW